MMPAYSTSDQRTYSSTTKGAGTGMPGEARSLPGHPVEPGSAHALLLPIHAVGLQPPPQRRATDAQPARRFSQLAVRRLQRVENGAPLLIRERHTAIARHDEHRVADIVALDLERHHPRADLGRMLTHLLGTDVTVAHGREDLPGRGVGIQQPAVAVEHRDALAERLQDCPPNRAWETGRGRAHRSFRKQYACYMPPPRECCSRGLRSPCGKTT